MTGGAWVERGKPWSVPYYFLGDGPIKRGLSPNIRGKKQPADWVQFVWQILQAQGQKLVKEGKTLETAEENLAELTEQANAFSTKQMPILKALQIA